MNPYSDLPGDPSAPQSPRPRFRVWMGGMGGQGIHFLAQVLCRAAYMEQQHALVRTDVEWAIRGGRTLASVLVDQAPFGIEDAGHFNWALVLHPHLRNLVPASVPEPQRLDAQALKLYELTQANGFKQGLNIALLGYFLACSEICFVESVVWQIKHLLGKSQMSVLPYNLELLEQGLERGERAMVAQQT